MIERENELASQMRLQEATNDRKNALEAYVYALRGKLSGPLEPYVTPADRDSIMAKLTETEVGKPSWFWPMCKPVSGRSCSF